MLHFCGNHRAAGLSPLQIPVRYALLVCLDIVGHLDYIPKDRSIYVFPTHTQ